jgi:8-oxo-dGTP diphosphatase
MTADDDDRRPAGERQVVFMLMGAGYEPEFAAVTSAAVVAVTDDDRLVIALLDRGPDIPGGHVEPDDASPEETIRRETWEEVRVRLGPLTRIDVIQTNYNGPDDLTYMVICAARVTEVAPWEAGFESAGRSFMEPADFLTQYRGDIPVIMGTWVNSAIAALRCGDPDGRTSTSG